MSVIVTDSGFSDDDWTGGFAPADAPAPGAGLDLTADTDPAALPEAALSAPLSAW